MTAGEHRDDAEWLLEEFKRDPKDWSTIDLLRLLELWGITGERVVTTEGGWVARVRFHPRHPDLNVVRPETEPVHPAIVLHTVRIIGTLRERERC